MIAVVTGGAGFIGSRLIARLQTDGYEVRVVDVEAPDIPVSHFVRADVRNVTVMADVVEDADVVFHLAGPVASGVVTSPEESRAVQLHGGHALRAAVSSRSPMPRLVLASTFYVYSGSSDAFVDENTALDVKTMHPFGRIKYEAERQMREFGMGLNPPDTVVARIGSAYGVSPRCTNVVRSFCSAAVKDRRILVWGNPDRVNQFTHVDDVVEGLVYCSVLEVGVYNIVSPESITTGALAHLIASKTGATVEFDRTKSSGPHMPYIFADRLMAAGWRARPLDDGLPLQVGD